jgi:PEGA domain
MKKLTSYVVLLSLLFFLSSCATLFKGTNGEVRFGSDPQKAEVWVNGTNMGETPITLKRESKKTYVIEFRKEGYKPVTRSITNHVSAGWVILDVLGALLPVIVDAATGAWYSLDQKNIDAVLEKQ